MNHTPDELHREYPVADRLHSTAIHLLRLLRVQDLKSGIGPARLSALSVLVFGGPKSLKSLAAVEQVRPPTMSRIVEGLQSEGLVRRRVSPHDRREIRLEATEKGRQILQHARRERVLDLSARLQAFSDEELSVLDQTIMLLRKVIEGK